MCVVVVLNDHVYWDSLVIRLVLEFIGHVLSWDASVQVCELLGMSLC